MFCTLCFAIKKEREEIKTQSNSQGCTQILLHIYTLICICRKMLALYAVVKESRAAIAAG